MSETLLRDIGEFCRGARMAESTFGRLAVNDGKLVSRLRLGGRVTTDTVERVRAFIARAPHAPVNGAAAAMPAVAGRLEQDCLDVRQELHHFERLSLMP